MRKSEDKIEISPAQVNCVSEHTVFDAIRDNEGKGIKAKDLVKLIKKLINKLCVR